MVIDRVDGSHFRIKLGNGCGIEEPHGCFPSIKELAIIVKDFCKIQPDSDAYILSSR
jgi:hypothetical protein